MNFDDLDKNLVCQYMLENKKDIPIIDTIKLTDYNYGRLDIILHRYYSVETMKYMELFLDFNGITDPTALNVGRLIDIPDFNYIFDNIRILKYFGSDGELSDEEKIPGVNKSMISDDVNYLNQKTSDSKITVGVPKLNIKLRKVSYNSETGKLTY